MQIRRAGIKTITVGVAVLGLFLTSVIASSSDLRVGDPAPNFELSGSDGKTYSLTDYRGKQVVVLAWFPKAFTGV
jgi:peroxiredoxin Q/BCP